MKHTLLIITLALAPFSTDICAQGRHSHAKGDHPRHHGGKHHQGTKRKQLLHTQKQTHRGSKNHFHGPKRNKAALHVPVKGIARNTPHGRGFSGRRTAIPAFTARGKAIAVFIQNKIQARNAARKSAARNSAAKQSNMHSPAHKGALAHSIARLRKAAPHRKFGAFSQGPRGSFKKGRASANGAHKKATHKRVFGGRKHAHGKAAKA